MNYHVMGAAALCFAVLFAGCGGPGGGDGGSSSGPDFRPIDSGSAVFWDRQTTETAALLGELTSAFNATYPALPIKIETTGNYGEIYQKTMGSIQAGQLPAMAVSYESMTAQYAEQGAVAPLDPHVGDPSAGLSAEDLADFYPAVLESNRYSAHGGAMLSFPFAKSVLVLYANHRVLRGAGIDAPPATWAEFLEQCRTIKAKTGKYAYAISVDCSTISAMIFSMGGEIVKGGELQYDQPAAVHAFQLLETLITEDLAYQIPARTFDDETAFASDRIAFTLRTSAGSANMAIAMGGKNGDWSINPIPQDNPERPATILFGPNVTLFKVGAPQEAAAWAFTKYFTSREVMVRWCLATGYVPFRKSVAEDPEMQAYWSAWPSNRVPYDALAYARTEPNFSSWQRVRKAVEQAETAVLTGLKDGNAAARDLQQEARAFLAASTAEN